LVMEWRLVGVLRAAANIDVHRGVVVGGVARERRQVLVLEDQTRIEVEVEGFERDDQSTNRRSNKQTVDD
jgi:hypothetical protein